MPAENESIFKSEHAADCEMKIKAQWLHSLLN
uniref:Uncharacterized protein n=1 Tax=Anguilla anguilla TaxID=7936 RepID=A0A0E9XUQ6_ANGAN